MAENSKIEWTDHTFNPWIGCTKVSPGCDHCYAEVRMDSRLHRVSWGAGQSRQRTKTWGDPVRWNKAHDAFYATYGRRQMVFCASLADVFDNEVPAAWRADLFDLIRATPNLDWLLLTKRIGNVRKMVEDAAEATVGTGALNLWLTQWAFARVPPSNVWLGATVVNQEEANRDIPKLLATPARVRFLSMEPLIGPVDLTQITVPRTVGVEYFSALEYDGDPDEDVELGTATLDWVIVGGESGQGARPMHPAWAESLRDQCAAAGVPFMFKQWGEWAPGAIVRDAKFAGGYRVDTDGHGELSIKAAHQFDQNHAAVRVGKKAAGRLLDGRTHDGFPTAREVATC